MQSPIRSGNWRTNWGEYTMTEAVSNNTVIGIDVGGARKGFHAVVMREGVICGKKEDCDPKAIVAWCLKA